MSYVGSPTVVPVDDKPCGEESPTSIMARVESAVSIHEFLDRPQRAPQRDTISHAQQRCLQVLYNVYSDGVFDDQRPSRLARSLSKDGWRHFCLDVLRSGPQAVPIIPMAELLRIYADFACSRGACFPSSAFMEGGVPPPRADRMHASFDGFMSMLREIAGRWIRRQRKVIPKGDQPSPLALMLHEAAAASFHNLELEATMASRQYKKAGQMRRVALWDLLCDQHPARPKLRSCLTPSSCRR